MNSMSIPLAEDPLSSRVTPDFLADALRGEITSGAFAPGAAIRQAEIASRFGVSRIPVREALRRLEAEGLVVVHANRGAFVRRFSAAEVREIYDLRIMIETDLIRRAVERITDAHLRAIKAGAAAAAAGASGPEWRDLDNRFHMALYAAAGRPHQIGIVAGLRGTVAHYRAVDDSLAADPAGWLQEHAALIMACEKRDSGSAVELLRSHLERAAELSVSYLEKAS